MDAWMDFCILVTFFLEVALLFYLEQKTWHSIFTPLNMLMIPYSVVLIVTLLVAGGPLGFVPFYYPSIAIWMVGLVLFAIPSYTLGFWVNKQSYEINVKPVPTELPRWVVALSFILSALFILHIFSTMGSSAEAVGSDEFGEELSGFGLWGHLRVISIPLLILCIYYVDKKHWWLWIPILVFISLSILNQVKSWTIIPCLAALAMRLYAGRTRFTLRLFLYIVLGGFLTFFIFYSMSILVVQEREVTDSFWVFIFGQFFHYLTSGLLGWSMDLERSLPDDGGSFEIVIAQFVNLAKVIVGDKELVDPVNPLYYNSGITLTNVRTFFGTLYINSNWLLFTLYILFLSTLSYGIRIIMIFRNNIWLFTIYFFNCMLLFMGWFDLFFASLIIVEVPIFLLLFRVMDPFLTKTDESYGCNYSS